MARRGRSNRISLTNRINRHADDPRSAFSRFEEEEPRRAVERDRNKAAKDRADAKRKKALQDRAKESRAKAARRAIANRIAAREQQQREET